MNATSHYPPKYTHMRKMQPCMLHLSLGRLYSLPILIADAVLGHFLDWVVSPSSSSTAKDKKHGARPSASVWNLIPFVVPATNFSS